MPMPMLIPIKLIKIINYYYKNNEKRWKISIRSKKYRYIDTQACPEWRQLPARSNITHMSDSPALSLRSPRILRKWHVWVRNECII